MKRCTMNNLKRVITHRNHICHLLDFHSSQNIFIGKHLLSGFYYTSENAFSFVLPLTVKDYEES